MADELKIEAHTVEMRLNRKGIKPIARSALYSPEALEAIRDVPGKGRPPKAKLEAPAKVTKPTKNAKPAKK
jgi:hypothetical protein